MVLTPHNLEKSRGTAAGELARGTVAGGLARGTAAGGLARGTAAGGLGRGTAAGGLARSTVRVVPAAVVDDDDDSEPDFDAVLRAAEKDERGDECIDAEDFDEVSDNDSEGEAAAALLEQLR
eukprot:gene13695-biopygen14118